MISTNKLVFQYDNGTSFNFKDFSSSPDPLLILGPSGCGKTTLLHLLAGLISPTSGEIKWNNNDIVSWTSQKRDKERAEQIGLIFQKPHFIAALNVEENILIQSNLTSKTTDELELDNLLDRLSIKHLKRKKINALSEGEKQRVSIARALICKPKYILADEPTSSLDDGNAYQVIDLLINESKLSKTQVLIITHDQRLKNKIKNNITL